MLDVTRRGGGAVKQAVKRAFFLFFVPWLLLAHPLQVRASASNDLVRISLFSKESLRTVVVESPGGLRVLGKTVHGPLHVYLRGEDLMLSNGKDYYLLCSKASITAARGSELTIGAQNERRKTLGLVTLVPHRGGVRVLNLMPSEVYVLGVVEPELGSLNFAPDSLRAQIVTSRSYLMAMRGRHSAQGFDFCDSAHCQVFKGMNGIRPTLLAASAAVRGKYLSYGGRAIPAFFHDSCGGMTAAADQVWPVNRLPYLRPVRDGDGEGYCRFAPKAHWKFEADQRLLQKCLVREGLLRSQDSLTSIRIGKTDFSGRAAVVCITGKKTARISANGFRLALNRFYGSEVLPSTLFTVNREGHRFVIAGRGWGHGVGLCQWGAIEMAKEGKSYQEILQHYFPGTQIDQIQVPIFAIGHRSRA